MFELCPSSRYGPRVDPKEHPVAKHTPDDAETAGAEPATVREIPDGPADASGLTSRQRLVLEVIRGSVERRGYPPSMRENGEAGGLTHTNRVAHQLSTPQRKGLPRPGAHPPPAVEVTPPH